MASGEAEPLKYQTWVLKVLIHCNGCTREVRKVLQSIDGVYRTVVDSQQHKVTVVGDVAVEVLIKKLVKIGKRAEVWPEKPQPNKEKEKPKETEDKKEKKSNNQTNEVEKKKDSNVKEANPKQPEEKKEKKKDANGNGAHPKQPEEKKEKKKDANGNGAKPKQPEEKKSEEKQSDRKKKASGKEPNPAGAEPEKNSGGGENASSQQQKQRQQYQQQQDVWQQFTLPVFLPPPVLMTSYNVAHPSSAGYWSYNSPIPTMSPVPEALPFHEPMPKFYDYYQQTPHCCAKSGGVCNESHREPNVENAAACRIM